MTTCLIIDDEPLAINLLASYVDKIDYLSLAGTFSNPLEALGFLQNNHVDVIFLDIQMPELSGIQFAKIIDNNTAIIFTTAYPNHALEGFELEVIDYLVKPITLERFIKATNRLKSNEPKSSKPLTSSKDYFFVKTEYKHLKINYADILYMKGYGDYVAIQKTNEKILTLENMKYFEKTLPSNQFVRVHKSYIISLDHISYIEKNRIVIGKEFIPIGGKYQDNFWRMVNGNSNNKLV